MIMKISKILAFLFLILAITSCKKEEAKTTIAPSVNTNLVLGKTELLVADPIRNLGYYFWIEKFSNVDFFAIHNYSNTNNDEEKGMMWYSVSENTFTDCNYSENVAAAGNTSKLVSVGGSYLYYCGNVFERYNSNSNSWDQNTYYPEFVKDNNGATGVCACGEYLYFIGGEVPSKYVKVYRTGDQVWSYYSESYPINISNTATATDNLRYIYSLGGYENADDTQSTKKFYRYDTQVGVWKQLPDCPRSISQSVTLNLMCFFKEKYLAVLCDDKKIYIYNIGTDLWQTNGIETGLTIDMIHAHLEASTDGTKFYVLYKKENDHLGISVYSPI